MPRYNKGDLINKSHFLPTKIKRKIIIIMNIIQESCFCFNYFFSL